ncbi:hypothetical protein [Cohnella sp. CIP 111063]|uniref:hypothetical protein n=1 Tax=unclassified Cohnella TaxID=2636738 RepID=UPI003519534D
MRRLFLDIHVMDEAARCDYLAMVRDGRILTSGTPRELMAQYDTDNLESVFLAAGGSSR